MTVVGTNVVKMPGSHISVAIAFISLCLRLTICIMPIKRRAHFSDDIAKIGLAPKRDCARIVVARIMDEWPCDILFVGGSAIDRNREFEIKPKPGKSPGLGRFFNDRDTLKK